MTDNNNKVALQAPIRSVGSVQGFVPSMLGLIAGAVAPHGQDDCKIGYETSLSPFKHPACHDPRRFVLFAFTASTDGAGVLTLAGGQSAKLFTAGVGDVDPEAGWTDFGVRTQSDTNLEKDGYLVPPGFEGLVSGIGFAPVGIFAKPTTVGGTSSVPGSFDQPATGMIDVDAALWRSILSAMSARFEYWEMTNKAVRYIGSPDRWPLGDGAQHRDLSSNGAHGAYSSRPNPLQYHIPTLGPAERRGDAVADRLQVTVATERTVVIAKQTTSLPVSTSFRIVLRCELSVGLMLDMNVAKNAEQDTLIGRMQNKIDELEAKIAGR